MSWILSSLALLLAPPYLPGQNLVFQNGAGTFVATNRYYTASISKQTGELQSVIDRIRGGAAISGDKLVIRVAGRHEPVRPADFSATRFSIEAGFDFYVQVVWSGTLSRGGGYRIERTYEFTNSPLVYEEVSILVGVAAAGVRKPTLALDEVVWEFRREIKNVLVDKAAADLWTELPEGPMGGLRLTLSGHPFSTKFEENGSSLRRRIVVAGRVNDPASTLAELSSGHGLIATSVLSIVGSLPDEALWRQPQFWFYPGYGLRSEVSESSFAFVNWDQYEILNRLVPLRRKYVENASANDWLQEDMLIRGTMHLVNRMKLDGGWPKWPSWHGAVTYPDGDIFTAHSRAFPAMAYLWNYLTIEWESGRWVHRHNDADVIYNQLQQLRKFYGVAPDASTINFEDRHEGVDYIAYSANRKEVLGNGPRGVLNTHAHALDFAWIMKEASELQGSSEDVKKWQAIVELYHRGSKMLYNLLYPGARDCQSMAEPSGGQTSHCNYLSGHVAYSIDNPCIYPGCGGPAAHPSYSFISQEGIAAGYLETGEYEPEFVDAVERASHLDYNPYGPVSPVPLRSLVARLCRVLPIALAFTNDTFTFAIRDYPPREPSQQAQYDISAASLREVNTFARLRFREAADIRRKHDSQKMIAEWGEEGLRKAIWTNKAFVTDWVPRFWQELDPEEVPPNLRFSLDVRRLGDGHVGNWAAYRTGNRIEVMADFDQGVATLKLPVAQGQTRFVMGYRDYNPQTLRWMYPVNETWAQAEARVKWGEEVQKYPTLAGDFDGDGKTDLAFPFQTKGGLTVRLLLSNGDGTWRQPPETQLKWGGEMQNHRTLVGDFDGDGKMDLAFLFQGEGGLTVRLLLSSGDGTWRQPPEGRLKWSPETQQYPTLVGDFDGDGQTDLAFLYQGEGGLRVRLLLSNGDGTWRQPPDARLNWGKGVQEYPTLVGDFDGDGKADLAFPFQRDGGLIVRLLLSNGDGTWRQPPEARVKWGPEVQKYPTLAGDFDGDGKTDLALPFQGDAGLTVRLLLTNGDGTWRQPPEAKLGWGEGVQKYPTLTGDVDGDQKADLIFPFQDWRDDKGLTVRTLLSNGDGTWATLEDRIKWGEGVQAHPTLTGYLKRDGTTDLMFLFQDWRDQKGLTVRTLLPIQSNFIMPPGGALVLPSLVKKRLVFVEIR